MKIDLTKKHWIYIPEAVEDMINPRAFMSPEYEQKCVCCGKPKISYDGVVHFGKFLLIQANTVNEACEIMNLIIPAVHSPQNGLNGRNYDLTRLKEIRL